MFGIEHRVKDIEMVTTNNSSKWLKFGVSYEYWCSKVDENADMFGIVKTSHSSKLGDVQRMSYQMVNCLDMGMMEKITQLSRDYIYQMKIDDELFFDYLRRNTNFSNDFDVLLALVENNPEFVRSDYYRERKRRTINNYFTTVKAGKLIQKGDNLTLVGSPYAMLMYTVGLNPEDDPTLKPEQDCIQCYSEMFDDGEYLAEFRNPFNSRNNLGVLHNHRYDLIKRYFNLGTQCIAVNTHGTDFEDRNNGSDFDSDSIYTTNQPEIVECAKAYYIHNPTIVNNIPKEKTKYPNTLQAFANIDNKLGASQRVIGESSNVAQIAQSYTSSDCFENKSELNDYVCILSVLAQAAIDNAKRTYSVNLSDEIARIKEELDIKKNGFPAFWSIIRPGFNKKRINPDLQCPMNYVYSMVCKTCKPSTSTLPISDFIEQIEPEMEHKKCKKVEELIEKYAFKLGKYNHSDENDDTYWLLNDDFDEMINDIRQTYISKNYIGLMSWLISRTFSIPISVNGELVKETSGLSHNRSLLLKTLYTVNPKEFLRCFSKNMHQDSEMSNED